MTYSLENFCMDSKASLLLDPGSGGREAIRAHLEKLLKNDAFIAEFLETQNRGKKVLFHDPETGFMLMPTEPIRVIGRASRTITAKVGQSMGKQQA